MKTGSNLLLKVAKTSLLVVGSVITVGGFAGAIYCYTFADQNKQFINEQVANAGNSLTNITTNIDSVSTNINENVETMKKQVNTMIDDSISALNTQIKNLNDLKNQIKTALDKVNQTASSSATESISKIIENLEQLKSILSEQKNNIDSAVDVDQIKNIVNQTNQIAQNYIGKINDVLAQIKPEDVNKYYDLITEILLIVSGVLLGLIVVGSLFSFICYKKIDGKLVNRFRAKKQIEQHLRVLLNKYPDVVDRFKKRGE